MNLIVLGVLATNVWFYGRYPAGWATWVQGGFLGLGLVWALLQIYTFPLLLEQRQRSLRMALRNSLVIYLKKPGLSLSLALLLAVLLGLSLAFQMVPWLVIGAALSAYLGCYVTRQVVKEYLSETTFYS
jgi:uncharacterized membrane protein YraQ (UPF0718 family)